MRSCYRKYWIQILSHKLLENNFVLKYVMKLLKKCFTQNKTIDTKNFLLQQKFSSHVWRLV